MNLFIYAPARSAKGDQLIEDISTLVPKESLEVFRTAQSLAARLLQRKNDFSVAILFNPKKEDLQTIIPIRNSIRETRFLLVLYGQKKEIISLAHRLFPTFISYVDNNNAELVSVLRRLIETHHKSLEEEEAEA